MKLFELITLTLQTATTGRALPALEQALTDHAQAATLLGCWTTEIGALNQVVILRSHADAQALLTARQAMLDAPSPFGCGEWLVRMETETFASFPFMPEILPGSYGPIYELRSYRLKPGGLQPTLGKWQAAVPGRIAFSPLTAALYALDGEPRITHLWPYESLDARTTQRAKSVRAGAWPPKGGPDWLLPDMRATIMLPTAFSPLQ